MDTKQQSLPIQPVDKPIICSPYEEPNSHWIYNKESGLPEKLDNRREAGYWYKTEKTGSTQGELFVEEERDDLPLVNLLRQDVGRWRESGYRGSGNVTKELLNHWSRTDRIRRLFFCQLEAVETIIYLNEFRLVNRSRSTGFQNFSLSDEDIKNLLNGERPSFSDEVNEYYPTLVDKLSPDQINPLRRLCCKMATGSGKTLVMSMLIAWSFCNRGQNPSSREYPDVALICCPNLTIKERLQVLRPEKPDNYYSAFDIVPMKYFPLLNRGKVLIKNWHALAPESEHIEGGKHYAVVNKGAETPETFAKRILGNCYDRLPIMVFNDEGHHCWRSRNTELDTELTGTEKKELETEAKTATVWIEGLDKINNCNNDAGGGIAFCVDLSATPFFISGSGHQEGHPFPWIVSDFGLVDAIESGLVKIPRIPVQDTTGRPDPIYFRLWESIKNSLGNQEFLPGRQKKPKPEAIYKKAEGALKQIAGQWVERYKYLQEGTVNQDKIPPVLIIVCDNIDTAKLFFEKISGEREEDDISHEEVDAHFNEEMNGEDDQNSEDLENSQNTRTKKKKKKIVYGEGEIFSEYFSNTSQRRYTIRIDSKQLAEVEGEYSEKKKRVAAEELRRIVSTVGKPGEPGEHVRCVVSVAMLNEGWDANNVTQILGIRAFGSQLLCEQVVGRGLRRLDYSPDPETGLLTEEYVDIYGIPFSVIPFKGRVSNSPQPEDKPKNHVRAIPEKNSMEMQFPVVEGFAFSLKKNLIRCNIDSMEELIIQPNKEPTATFVSPTVGYQEGTPSVVGRFSFEEQNRSAYYDSTHLQSILFQIANQIVNKLVTVDGIDLDDKKRVFRLQSRHTLFPQVFNIVNDYVQKKVNFQGQNQCELGLQEYVERLIGRLLDGIEPVETKGESPLLPLLNRYKPIGSTIDIDFKTTRSCFATESSHVNLVVADTKTWETSAAFKIEQAVKKDAVKFYVRNDNMGFVIPYEYDDVNHFYEPDFLVRLNVPDKIVNLILEIKGYEDDLTKAKNQATKRWVSAVNNWGNLGYWEFHICKNPQKLDLELEYLNQKLSS